MIWSDYVAAIVLAWLIAHAIKYAVAFRTKKQKSFREQVFISGGMPSSHAATTTAVWLVVLVNEGVESAAFGIMTLLTLIVCYDAVKVRRSSGEQGEALRQLIKETKKDIKLPVVARGHTVKEVVAGIFLGLSIGGLVVIFSTV